MRLCKLFFLILILHSQPGISINDTPSTAKKKAIKDLEAYYSSGTMPPFEKAFSDMKSDNDSIKKFSAEYIYSLFVQSQDDEKNGRLKLTQLPLFSETGESKAHIFRQNLALYFGEKADSPELLKTAEWMILSDSETDNKSEGMKVVRRLKCPETDSLLGKLILTPHLNEKITIESIEEIAGRRLLHFSPVIDSMQYHYRADIREAIYKNAPKLDISIKEFDPLKALTPWVKKQFELINSLILDKVPGNSSFVSVIYELPGRGGKKLRSEYTGWLIGANNTSFTILDYSAQKVTLEKKYSTVRPASMKDETARLLSNNNTDDSRLAFRNIRPHFGNELIPYYTMAVWYYNANEKEEAIRLLADMINYSPDDSTFTIQTAGIFGSLYYNDMLHAFSQERDYDKSIMLCRHLSEDEFAGFLYSNDAVQLGKQLLQRTSDFKEVILPSKSVWDSLGMKLQRSEQIKYLAERLRILNCIQKSQPGEIMFSDKQYSVPSTYSAQPFQIAGNFPPRDMEQKLKDYEVINPYNELMHMNLTPADIRIIAPYLADTNYILAYSFHRDFMGQRILYKVGRVVSDIIFNSTGKEFFDISDTETSDNDTIQNRIIRIIQWCDENSHKPETEPAREAVQLNWE